MLMDDKGLLFDPFNLKDSDFEDITESIAMVLARIPRFGGRLRINYTVAQHCLSMADLVDDLYNGDIVLKKWAMAHELFEFFTGLDVPTPIKLKMPQYREAEERALKRFMELNNLPYPMPEEIRILDAGLLVMEATALLPNNPLFDWEKEIGVKPMGSLFKLQAHEDRIRFHFENLWQHLFYEAEVKACLKNRRTPKGVWKV